MGWQARCSGLSGARLECHEGVGLGSFAAFPRPARAAVGSRPRGYQSVDPLDLDRSGHRGADRHPRRVPPQRPGDGARDDGGAVSPRLQAGRHARRFAVCRRGRASRVAAGPANFCLAPAFPRCPDRGRAPLRPRPDARLDRARRQLQPPQLGPLDHRSSGAQLAAALQHPGGRGCDRGEPAHLALTFDPDFLAEAARRARLRSGGCAAGRRGPARRGALRRSAGGRGGRPNPAAAAADRAADR